jgi:plastocyanin
MRSTALALALLLTSAFLMAGCSGSGGTPVAGKTVELKGLKFVPEKLTIKKGEKVTWINRDAVAHTVTSNETGGPLDSPMMQGGATYSHTFAAAGVFKYHCKPHSGSMYGTITVTE